jgi:hypothetical protein
VRCLFRKLPVRPTMVRVDGWEANKVEQLDEHIPNFARKRDLVDRYGDRSVRAFVFPRHGLFGFAQPSPLTKVLVIGLVSQSLRLFFEALQIYRRNSRQGCRRVFQNLQEGHLLPVPFTNTISRVFCMKYTQFSSSKWVARGMKRNMKSLDLTSCTGACCVKII